MTASRVVFIAPVLVLWSFSILFAQRVGEIRSVTVPFRSEAWSSSAARGPVQRRADITVPAPRHVQAAQAQVTATAAAPTASAATTSSLVGQVFPGPADEVPPDSDVAAGPNHVVATVNALIVIYDKKGKQISQAEATSFFGSVSGPGCCFDLRVLYDQTNNRFIVAAAETDYTAPASHILIAVSATSDPTRGWNKYAINGSTVFWSDFPTLGISASALYVVADRIPFSPGAAGWDLTIVQMPELLSGNSNLRITDFPNVVAPSGAMVDGPIIPAVTYGASDREFLVSIGPPGVIYLYSVPTSGTPTLNSVQLNTTPYPAPPLAPQPGSSVGLSVGGDAMFTAVWRDGSLWVAQSVGNGPGNPSASAIIRWYEIDPVTPTVRQLGTVTGAGNAYIPALTVRPDGEVDLVYTTSSTMQFASAGYAHRNPTDPPNTMSASGIYKPGDSDYPLSRWGDISGISVDPSSNSTWGIAEYATKGTFGTSIVQILTGVVVSPTVSLSVEPAAATIAAGQTATFTVSTSGQALTVPVTLACTQGLPSGAACTFSPTSVSSGNSATLTISTTPRSSANLRHLFTFSFLSLLGLAFVARRSRGLLALCCVVIVLGLLVSCGGVGKSSGNPGGGSGGGSGGGNAGGGGNGGGGGGGGGGAASGTPAGSYSVTVTGTSSGVSGATTLNLTVQ